MELERKYRECGLVTGHIPRIPTTVGNTYWYLDDIGKVRSSVSRYTNFFVPQFKITFRYTTIQIKLPTSLDENLSKKHINELCNLFPENTNLVVFKSKETIQPVDKHTVEISFKVAIVGKEL